MIEISIMVYDEEVVATYFMPRGEYQEKTFETLGAALAWVAAQYRGEQELNSHVNEVHRAILKKYCEGVIHGKAD